MSFSVEELSNDNPQQTNAATNDPYAEFGGVPIAASKPTATVSPSNQQTNAANAATNDPYAEFGGFSVEELSGESGKPQHEETPRRTVYRASPEESTPEGYAAAVARREAEHPIITAVGKGSGEALGDIWDAVKGLPSGLYHNLPPVQLHDTIKQNISVLQAYEQARSSGKGVIESLRAASEVARQQDAAHQMLQARIEEFKKHPGQATVRGIADAAAIAATIYDGGAANPANIEVPANVEANAARLRAATSESGAETAAETATQPGIVKQVLKGEKSAQPQAQEALRTSTRGLTTTVQPQSLRELLSEPIDSLTAKAKASYRAVDDAAGTDFKALNEKLENTEYQIRNLTETEEDLAKEGSLEKSRQGIIDKINEAKQTAIDNGVNPKLLDEADREFTQAQALKDVEAKVFKNPNVVRGNVRFKTPETVDVNAAIRTIQKLQDNEKYGAPRLEQALGKDGANGLLNDLYEAQRAGQTALTRQRFAKLVGKYVVGALGVAYGGHLLHALGE
jgi:hypothetical protein